MEGDSWLQGVFKTDWTISIHALRVEGDRDNYGKLADMILAISIHALRVEGDSVTINQQDQDAIFLSTPSGWRATVFDPLIFGVFVRFLSTPSG